MNILVVHAHPEPQSFCAAMKDVAVEELQAQGHEVALSDLYAMRFDPVAKAADFAERANPDYLVYALEQRHATQSRTLPADVRAELDKLLACDLLVLSFPVFWFSVPAILKGWIDRVLVSGAVYGGMRFYDHGGLAGKRAFVAATLGGQPHMFGADAVHGPIDDMFRHLLRGTLAYTGLQVLPPFFGYHVPYISAAERADVLERFRARVRGLGAEQEGLWRPSLDAFDAQLRPLPAATPTARSDR